MQSRSEPLVDEILLTRARRLAKKHPYGVVEKEARWETWQAYTRRNRGRLFDPGPHEGREDRQWRSMEDQWWGKAIGCVAVLDREVPDDGSKDYFPFSYSEAVIVGRFMGVDRGYFGSVDFVVGHFSGPGTSTHRSPLNVGFVHVLGEPYQKLVDINYADDDDPGEWDEC